MAKKKIAETKTTMTQPQKPAKALAPEKPKRLSAIDAAAMVLSETRRAMTCQEMIVAMAERGYWTSPAGKTPAQTLYAAILREIRTKGKDSRFFRLEPGKFVRTQTKE